VKHQPNHISNGPSSDLEAHASKLDRQPSHLNVVEIIMNSISFPSTNIALCESVANAAKLDVGAEGNVSTGNFANTNTAL